MAKVALIGGTGMVGRPVARQLLANGHEVALLTRDVGKARALAEPRLRAVAGTPSDPPLLRAAFEDVEAVVVVMPLSVEGPGEFNMERDGTRAVLDALPERDVRIVKLSEIGAGSDPSFRDLQSKADAEELIRASGRPFVILRPTWFVEAWLGQLRAGPDVLAVGEGRRGIHWVSLADMARWMARAVTSTRGQGRTMTAQGPDAFTMPEAAERVAAAIGARVISVPADAVRPPGACEGIVVTLAELFRHYERTPEPFEGQELWDVLGEPEMGFEEFLRSRRANTGSTGSTGPGS